MPLLPPFLFWRRRLTSRPVRGPPESRLDFGPEPIWSGASSTVSKGFSGRPHLKDLFPTVLSQRSPDGSPNVSKRRHRRRSSIQRPDSWAKVGDRPFGQSRPFGVFEGRCGAPSRRADCGGAVKEGTKPRRAEKEPREGPEARNLWPVDPRRGGPFSKDLNSSSLRRWAPSRWSTFGWSTSTCARRGPNSRVVGFGEPRLHFLVALLPMRKF
mmetsp:Transcript_13990/g.48531  ORF Transcript_13990/g.48531 Transcript_13990/m.48531 type:complete len:212 (+) Transcript_13990:271-906(+)